MSDEARRREEIRAEMRRTRGGGAPRLAGRVDFDGTVLSGRGFTVAHNGVGDFTVTFLRPFPTEPAVIPTAIAGSPAVTARLLVDTTLTTAQIGLQDDTGAAIDTAFHFTAEAT